MNARPNDETDDPGAGSHAAAHLDWETLNDLVDGRLERIRAAGARRHLASCPHCRAAAEALTSMTTTAASLAPSIDPPPALWNDVAGTISTVQARHVPPAAPDTHGASTWRVSPRWLAAAAVVLMALSSATTVIYLRSGSGERTSVVTAGSAPNGAGAGAGLLPASFIATERAYLTSVSEVEALLTVQRASLSPSTVGVIDRALATIDAAITEAREALLADPANQSLARLLETSYRQKLELLRRAAEFPHAS